VHHHSDQYFMSSALPVFAVRPMAGGTGRVNRETENGVKDGGCQLEGSTYL